MTNTELYNRLIAAGGQPLSKSSSFTSSGPTISWNFGLTDAAGETAKSIDDVPKVTGYPVYSVAPQIRGAWDGSTNVSGWLATKQVLGTWLEAQAQKIGSCGGAATSGGLNVMQCLQIASGKRSDVFKRVSRAWCYVGAREIGGHRGRGEGVIPPYPLDWCKAKGAVHIEETGTNERYDSDNVASSWDRSGIPRNIMELAIDNLIVDMAPCYDFQSAADVIASGGVVMVASDQGFTMERDREGVCQPQGEWMHYMYFASVHKLPSGRRVLGCGQSWGQNVPDGPTLENCPDYVFGVEERTVNRMLGQRTSTGVTAFAGWASDYKPWSW
jgi:hypothetical protein